MNSRLNHIDALRGLAVAGVIAMHSLRDCDPLPESLRKLISQGSYGVQLFYVLSAYTLFLSLSSRGASERHSLRNFFIRRYFRIAPLFWCSLIYYLWHDGLGPRYWLGSEPAVTPLNILSTATFTNSLNPYWINSIVPGGWSVAIEMLFYLSVPFLFSKLKTIDAAIAFTFGSLIVSLILAKIGRTFPAIPDAELWNEYLGIWLPAQLPVFGLGFVLFFLSRNIQSAPAGQADRAKPRSLFLMAVCLYLFFALTFGSFRFLPTHFLYGLTCVALIVALQLYPIRLLVNRPMIYLGTVSYSAYLTHFAVLYPVQALVRGLREQSPQRFPPIVQYVLTLGCVAIGTVVVSTLTYYLIETPGQKLGRRLITALDERRAQKLPPELDAGI